MSRRYKTILICAVVTTVLFFLFVYAKNTQLESNKATAFAKPHIEKKCWEKFKRDDCYDMFHNPMKSYAEKDYWIIFSSFRDKSEQMTTVVLGNSKSGFAIKPDNVNDRTDRQ